MNYDENKESNSDRSQPSNNNNHNQNKKAQDTTTVSVQVAEESNHESTAGKSRKRRRTNSAHLQPQHSSHPVNTSNNTNATFVPPALSTVTLQQQQQLPQQGLNWPMISQVVDMINRQNEGTYHH